MGVMQSRDLQDWEKQETEKYTWYIWVGSMCMGVRGQHTLSFLLKNQSPKLAEQVDNGKV